MSDSHAVLVTNCAYGNSRSMNSPHTINTDVCCNKLRVKVVITRIQ